MKKSFLLAASFAFVLVGAAACSGNKSADNAANAAASAAGNAANTAASAAGNAGNAMQNAAGSAGSAMQGAASGAMGSMGMSKAPNCGAVKAVWVNTTTHVYHVNGDPYYMHTKHGMLLCPAQAKSQGYHAAGAGAQ